MLKIYFACDERMLCGTFRRRRKKRCLEEKGPDHADFHSLALVPGYAVSLKKYKRKEESGGRAGKREEGGGG